MKLADMMVFDASADSSFAPALQAQLEAKKRLTVKERRILAILKGSPSPARSRRIARMENWARGAIGVSPNASKIDWSKIDWAKVLEIVLKVLMMLLPLLI